MNVATRLRGSASHFYRSCPPQQRSSYQGIKSALQQRFTPVRIQSVQSSRFHERKQLSTETVANYAQDLRKLFNQAYTTAQNEGGAAEAMGQSVLSYQFVAGLIDPIKAKLVGAVGMIDEVLYHVEPDKTLRIIPPSSDRHRLFRESHEGPFSGHLREAKIHSQLSRQYWWLGMRKDITHWCRACLPCATRSVGRPVRPPLTPIPVGGPFD